MAEYRQLFALLKGLGCTMHAEHLNTKKIDSVLDGDIVTPVTLLYRIIFLWFIVSSSQTTLKLGIPQHVQDMPKDYNQSCEDSVNCTVDVQIM